MPSFPVDSDTYPAYRKSARDEPLPGYVLLEPLGRGGFGEVWKCEAPGGLLKAIKFVPGGDGVEDEHAHQFQQEFDAFLHIKAIRHPFLLTLERTELIGNDLVMVMELADRQMWDRFEECRAAGLPGIPRDELLRYFSEAAEALDVLNADHGLQHLDVKPANLFITAGHVKVGDYGLVSRLDCQKGTRGNGGLTPKYVAPEVLRGSVDPRSDQYSLALVYQEMLTGVFPYASRSAQQMMLAHVSGSPDLSALPEHDRLIVAKALSKNPGDRFELCQEFVNYLVAATPAISFEEQQASQGTLPLAPDSILLTPGPAERTGRISPPASGTLPNDPRKTANLTRSSVNRTLPQLTTPKSMPPLVAPSRWPSGPARESPPPVSPVPVPGAALLEAFPLAEGEAARIVVNPIRSVIPTGRLQGASVPDAILGGREFAEAVVAASSGGRLPSQIPGDIAFVGNSAWACQFPTTVPEPVAPLKLSMVRDQWALAQEQASEGRIVFRKFAAGGLWGALSGKKSGLEVVVRLPRGEKSVGEVSVMGSLFGTPDRGFLEAAQSAIPKIIEGIRRELGNVTDRRKDPRIAAEIPLIIRPIHSDGTLDPVVSAKCRDVSVGGVSFSAMEPIKTRYVYIEFGGLLATAGLAALVKLIRSQKPVAFGGAHIYAGPFRLEL